MPSVRPYLVLRGMVARLEGFEPVRNLFQIRRLCQKRMPEQTPKLWGAQEALVVPKSG